MNCDFEKLERSGAAKARSRPNLYKQANRVRKRKCKVRFCQRRHVREIQVLTVCTVMENQDIGGCLALIVIQSNLDGYIDR